MAKVAILGVILLSLFISVTSKKSRKGVLRKISYKKYNHDTESKDTAPATDLEGPIINPSKSWARFIELQNQDKYDRSEDSLLMATKSTGSKNINAIEPIPGPRGPAGPPGVVILDQWTDALKLLKETEGDVKRSRKGRYKSGGPVLNVVLNTGNSLRDIQQLDLNNISLKKNTRRKWNQSASKPSAAVSGGFYSTLKVDIYLQRLSRLQISNFLKPRPSPTSFTFSSGMDFNHRSGAFKVPVTGIYKFLATLNLERMDDKEQPGFEDNIAARICLDDDCLIWDLETRIPLVHTKYSSLSLSGIARLEAGKNAFLLVENNSSLNFKVLKTSGFSSYLMGGD